MPLTIAMPKSAKTILVAVGAAAGIAVLVMTIVVLIWRVNAKTRIESIASKALQMEVHIEGRLSVGLLSGLHVALADVHLGERNAEVGSAKEVDLRMELLPLLHKEVRIDKIELRQVTLAVERDQDGKLTLGALAEASAPLPELAVARMSVSDATFTYADKQSGKTLEAEGCNLDVSRLQLSSGGTAGVMNNLSLAARIACAQLRTKDFAASDLRFDVDGHGGVFQFAPVTMRLFGGHGTGSVRAEFSGAVPIYQVTYRLAQFRLEEFFKSASSKSIANGSMDLSATLSLRGDTIDALVRSFGGVASLRGENFQLAIGNLDEQLSRYESSQRFNLIDLGAFFFAGPLGLVVTKGYDFARIFPGAEGSTSIRILVSEWQVERGIAHAKDVAMATQKNRVALKGGLDFVSGQYDDVTVAVVDARGCAKVEQKVHGTFMKPVVDQPNAVGTLTGPTRRLLRQAGRLFGAKCAVFYTGSVAPPK